MTESAENHRTETVTVGDPTKCARRVVSIESIDQTSGRYRVGHERPEGALTAHFLEKRAAVSHHENRVEVDLDFILRMAPAREDEHPPSSEDAFFEALATFHICYELKEGDPFTPQDLQAFGDINGRLNTTAYWREYVHNCLARAGLPTYFVPPFNAQQRLQRLRAQERSESSSE